MTITLYKDVELRSDYSVVFDCDSEFWSDFGVGTPFDAYLNLKKSRIVRTIDNTYFSNDGVLSIDWTVFDGDYEGFTYMKVESDMMDEKFFFINSYEYKNEMLILYYSIDIWHTYSAKMKIHDGIISRANIKIRSRRTLPIEYETNKSFNFIPVYEPEERFYLVAEFSFFQLQTGENIDDSSYRYNYTSIVTHNTWSIDTESYDLSLKAPPTVSNDAKPLYSFEEAIRAINLLTAYQGVQPLGENKKTDDGGWRPSFGFLPENDFVMVKDKLDLYHDVLTPALETANEPDKQAKEIRYEIVQFFLIPASFIESLDSLGSIFEMNEGVNASALILTDFGNAEVGVTYKFEEYQFLQLKDKQAQIHEVNFAVGGNPTTAGFGLKSLFIPAAYNNLQNQMIVRTTFSPIGFDMALETQQGFIEITDQFEIPIPFTTLSATERQLAALSRQQAKRQKAVAIATTAVMAGVGIAGVVGAAPGIAGIASSGALDISAAWAQPASMAFGAKMLNRAKDVSLFGAQTIGDLGKAAAPLAKQGVGLMYSVNNMLDADMKLKAPIGAGQANNSSPDAFINAYYGLGEYSLIPNNEEVVDYAVQRTGYNVFIKTNDYHHNLDVDDLFNKYEPIQFSTAQVSGAFGNDVRAGLEAILLGGTIISYSPTVYNYL